jgi:hypothetical protein
MLAVIDRDSMISASKEFSPSEVVPVSDIEVIREKLELFFSKNHASYQTRHNTDSFDQELKNRYVQIKNSLKKIIKKLSIEGFNSSLSWLQKSDSYHDSLELLFNLSSEVVNLQELILNEINELSEEFDERIKQDLTIEEIEEQEGNLEFSSQLSELNNELISFHKVLISFQEKIYSFYSLCLGFYLVLEPSEVDLSNETRLGSISEGLFHIFDVLDRFYGFLDKSLIKGILKNAEIILKNTNALHFNQLDQADLNSKRFFVNIRAYCLGIIQKCSIQETSDQNDFLQYLYSGKESYDYIKNQDNLFSKFLPEIVQNYAGKYILFEDGRVIDSDSDEDILLDRVWESDFVKERSSIFVKKVPQKIVVNA